MPTREKQTGQITRGNRLTRTDIPTREKEIAHVTTEGAGEREWRSLRERNRQRM
jgi:hypothetical protein